MILQSLKQMAETAHLTADLDYEPKAVPWIITLAGDGRYTGVVGTVVPDGPKNGRRAKTMRIPRRRMRRANDLADFLVDKSEYVFGTTLALAPEGRLKARADTRRKLFAAEIADAYAKTRELAFAAISKFLDDTAARQECLLALKSVNCTDSDLLCFEVDGQLVHDLPAARQYFRSQRQSGNLGSATCLVCGSREMPVENHPSIQVRGGTSSGIALVSFNASAFESYGWSRNENAPVCRNCAEGYTTGLRRLLSDRYPDPEAPNATLARRFVHLNNNTTAIFWADQDSESLNSLASMFDGPNEDSVRALLESPWKGTPSAALQPRFYCLLISGGQGRAILRGVHSGTLPEVEENVREYFRILKPYGERPLPLFLLLRSVAVLEKQENLPPQLAGEMFLSILFGLQFPRNLLSAAVLRCRAEQKVTRERAAVLALFFSRTQPYKEMIMALNTDSTDPGYRLGRLLAVLERLQSEAQKNANKTIVDRYYGAASTRPLTVFPALMHLAQHHAGKLPNPGYFQKQVGEVVDGVAEFPATLSLAEQGMFALGYYHQRQEFFKKRTTEKTMPDEITTEERNDA